MVTFTPRNDPRNMFQDVEIASESTNPVNVSLQEKDNTRTSYIRDGKKDDGYETFANIEHMTYMKHVKDEDAMTVKDQGPKKCMIPHGAKHSDYADIDI
ncbi:hypothetical protein CHS0354_012803 [Potamilus streckersoni]|uniref:Uncharacterized protein n=1 Tax=Potamilus streckersoni TaxID=2493646 RepID=A0AAE0SW76_9BIVA|nr:hypothetical protein CHS0354_012803 [Potamilus streckersoni]